jgi:hypothetical protein
LNGISVVAVLPDPYFALPSLYGAPAYSRPPRPPVDVARPLDPDDLPLDTEQTEEERRIADELLASRGYTPAGTGSGYAPAAGGDAGYRVSGGGSDGRELGIGREPGLTPRRLSLRGLAGRIRPHD